MDSLCVGFDKGEHGDCDVICVMRFKPDNDGTQYELLKMLNREEATALYRILTEQSVRFQIIE